MLKLKIRPYLGIEPSFFQKFGPGAPKEGKPTYGLSGGEESNLCFGKESAIIIEVVSNKLLHRISRPTTRRPPQNKGELGFEPRSSY